MSSRIRKMEISDLELVLSWRNHPEVSKYMYTRQKITSREHQRWFERAQKSDAMHLLIFENMSEPCGFIQFCEKNNSRVFDWGFYLSPNAALGSGKELGKHALTYAFNKIGAHKICGEAIGFNERSINFHKVLGFHQEGILRDHYFDGSVYHDVFSFGILRSEWVVYE